MVAAEPVSPGVVRLTHAPGRTPDADGVQTGPSGLSFHDPDGRVVCAGGRIVRQAWQWAMPAGTRYFGLGERTGLLEKKGGRYTFWNTDEYEHQGPDTDSLYQSIPFLLAVDETGRCHGMLIEWGGRCVIDLSDVQGQRLTLHGGDDAPPPLLLIAGPTPADVVRRMTSVTGRMPLPPRWALGYHHARWGYRDADDIRRVAKTMRDNEIPADVLYLDIDHQDEFRAFTWSPQRFPDPAGLVAELAELGFKAAATANIGIKHQLEGGYGVFDDGMRHDVFLRDPDDPGKLLLRHVWPGLCAFPDFVRADVRAWWGQWYRKLLDEGVRVVVNDMNEPAMHDLPMRHPESKRVDPPPQTMHGTAPDQVPHTEVHNVYATLEAQATYEAWRRLRPDQRPMLLSRAGSTGIQRYAAVWTGDNRSLWEHLEMSLPQLMNLGLSGVPFVGADIGGFFGNGDAELLVRWYQLGAWYPLARANNAEDAAPQEPWVWGEPVTAACRRALNRRYELLPYWYTLFAEAARTGAPVLRPLLYHYPDDERAVLRDDEALLGRDILIAPVLRPGRVTREVYLPRGRWRGLHDGTVHIGPATILTGAPLYGDLPAFVRLGAIVPFGPSVRHADEKPLDPLTLHVHADEDGSAEGTLYEDDGTSMSYLDGDFALTHFRFRDGRLSAQTSGRFRPPEREIVVHQV